MKIYTRTGDDGTTGLLSGRRVSKADARLEAYGTTDELNAFLGLLADQPATVPHRPLLQNIQERLFTIGAHLALDDDGDAPHRPLPDLHATDIEQLETEIDRLTALLPPLRHFLLPGGHETVSLCHVARTVCRRAERQVVGLSQLSAIEPGIICYLNRLSDYLFVLGRALAASLSVPERRWTPRTS